MQELQEWENLCLHHCPSRSRLQRTCLPCHRVVARHHSISVISSSRNRASRPCSNRGCICRLLFSSQRSRQAASLCPACSLSSCSYHARANYHVSRRLRRWYPSRCKCV